MYIGWFFHSALITFDYTPDYTGGRQHTSSVQDTTYRRTVVKQEKYGIFVHGSYQEASLPVAHVKWE